MRSITAEDLARLRDIGPSSNANIAQAIFSLSPDGKRMAFPLRRGEPGTNTYCMGMFVADVRPDSIPVQVNAGGKYILYLFSIAGFVESSSSGTSEVTTPLWSPDGQWIAFLRQDDAFPQVWRARADGSFSEQVTHADFAVKSFAWSADGKTIVFAGKPALESARAALPAEGNQGFLYDERFMPIAGNWPRIREPIPMEYFTIDPSTGNAWPASESERAVLVPPKTGPADAVLYKAGAVGRQAWTSQPVKAPSGISTVLHASANGRDAVWNTAVGQSIDQLWWNADGQSLVFLTHEATRGSIALYLWNLTDPPRTILKNDDVLVSCQMATKSLVCGRERSTEPRRLVRVDLETGRQETLFDPNPEYATLRFGTVRRLYWKNSLGLKTYGDLVLPPDHKPGQKHPLIVVQYTSRGFLRGGTGDEFPVQAYAANGFAVLNFTRPQSPYPGPGATDAASINRASVENWADRKSVQSSLDAALDVAIATGDVDADQIGITGLSDGSSTVQYALVHSHRFKAAAMATCCDEPAVIDWLDGPAGNALYHKYGFPALGPDHDSRWKGQSLVLNATEVDTPLLMQLPDHEYLAAIQAVQALKEAGKPVEAYVFPDEYHVKWQPAHRLASYLRSIDWFRFWLMDAKDADPAKALQYGRWEAMASKLRDTRGASPGH